MSVEKNGVRLAIWVTPAEVLFSEDLWVLELLNAGYGIMDEKKRNRWIDQILERYNRVIVSQYYYIKETGEDRMLELFPHDNVHKDSYMSAKEYLYSRTDFDLGRDILKEICTTYPDLWKKNLPSVYNLNAYHDDYNLFYLIEDPEEVGYDCVNILQKLYGIEYSKIIRKKDLVSWCKKYIDTEKHHRLLVKCITNDVLFDYTFVENYENSFSEEEKDCLEITSKVVMYSTGNKLLLQMIEDRGIASVDVALVKLWDVDILNRIR